jgi:ArsR family transcriptional regulator
MKYHIFGHVNILPESIFRALADPTRLRCLALLEQEGELCVCELTYALDVVQPKVSRHLASLREVGMVSDRREGLWVHYQIHPDLPQWVRGVIRATAAGVATEEPFASDRSALSRMPNRPETRHCV